MKGIFKNPMRRWGWLFLGPVTAAFCIGFVWPFIQGIYLSFCKFKLISKTTWVGFDNYVAALKDASFMHSFWYTALFAIVSLIFINVLGFAAAYALTQGIRGSNLYRTVFFMPNLIGGIVLGYIWSMIFDGILSRYGTSILLETKYGFWGLIILMCWQQIGYMMIIYIAGLQSVPEDMLEAAKIDGATRRQTLFRVRDDPERHAVHHDLHLPEPHQRLQALRPEPGADRRAAVHHSGGRLDDQNDGNDGAEYLQYLLRTELRVQGRGSGQGGAVLYPGSRSGPCAAVLYP